LDALKFEECKKSAAVQPVKQSGTTARLLTKQQQD